MITTFGSLYAGHVDLENIGPEGTPVNERWLSDAHLASVFEKAKAIATCLDQLGYDTLWAVEHRFQREGYGHALLRSAPAEGKAKCVRRACPNRAAVWSYSPG